MRPRIRIVLADDHAVLRSAVARLVGREPDMEIVGEASDGLMAVAMVLRYHPDIVIMDTSMPRMNGIEATRKIASLSLNVRVVGFSMYKEKEMFDAMRKAGACATVVKGVAAEVLLATLREHGYPEQAAAS